MVELKSFIDETFNTLKSKIEDEYNKKIKEHFTKISIDVSNDTYSNDEYGKIDIGKIKHPEGRYIIHQIEFHKEKDSGNIGHLPWAISYPMRQELWKHIDKFQSSGTMLIDNYGERYVFFKCEWENNMIYNYGPKHSPNIKANLPLANIMYIKNIIDFEYQLIPSINEYEYPLTNKIIDFVKSQNFPIDNLNTLSKIISSIEIYKKTYNDKNKELLSQVLDLQTKLDEQLKINEILWKHLFELKK